MNIKIPKLIDDIPTSEDKFGAHHRLAMTLNNIIQHNNGGKTISIEGEWGSGKSSVIKLLSKEIQEDRNVKLICYDAWVHSGDPLRRAFLNTLIDDLLITDDKYTKVGWLYEPDNTYKINKSRFTLALKKDDGQQRGYWGEKKDELAGKFKITKKEVYPILKKDGRYLLLSLFIYPLASLIFINLLGGYAKSPNFFTQSPAWVQILFWVAILFIATPFFIIGKVVLKARKEGNSLDKFFGLLFNKNITEEETSSLETPDPSTIEFQEVFSEALNMALHNKDRKLVIVIDNLDRLSHKEAENVWSLLRSFIDQNSFKVSEYPWIERLWIIVPISHQDSRIEASQDENGSTKVNNNSEQFLEKVFQVRLHLPPPVLSDWQTYLSSNFEYAFGKISDSDQKDIHRLYEGYLQGNENNKTQKRPTPRSLVLFVNDVVVLRLLWPDQFTLQTLAAYALSTHKENILESLQNGLIPTERDIRLLGPNLKYDFAALFFNVPNVRKAQELLLLPLAEQKLKWGDAVALEELVMANEFFEDFLESVITESLSTWIQLETIYFFKALSCLNTLNNSLIVTRKQGLQPTTLRFISISASHALENLKYMPYFVSESAEGIIAFLDLIPDDRALNAVINILGISSNATEDIEEFRRLDTSLDWLYMWEYICDHPRIVQALQNIPNDSICLPIKTDEFAEFSTRCLDDDNKLLLMKFRPVATDIQVSKHLITKIIDTTFTAEDANIILRARTIGTLENYENCFNAMQKALIANNLNGSAAVPLISTLLLTITSSSKAKLALKELMSNGVLFHYFYTFTTTNDFASAGHVFLAILNQDSSGTIAIHGNSEQGKVLFSKIVANPSLNLPLIDGLHAAISIYQSERTLIDLTMASSKTGAIKTHELVKKLFELSKDKINIYKAFDIRKINAELNAFITNILDEDEKYRKSISKTLIENFDLLQDILSDDLQSSQAWLYVSILLNDDIQDDLFLSKCRELLSKDTSWLKYLKTSTSMSRLAYLLSKRNLRPTLGKKATNALIDLAKLSLLSPDEVTINPLNLDAIIKSLKSSKTFEQEVYWIANAYKGEIPKKFWNLFGESISRYLMLNKANHSLLISLLNNCLLYEDIDGIKTITKVLENKNGPKLNPDTIEVIKLRKNVGNAQSTAVDATLRTFLNKLIKFTKRKRA